LAEQSGAVVDALHVVDTKSAWKLLNFDRPGLMGSGVHVDAYKSIKNVLQSLASVLADTYTSRAGGRAVRGEVFVEEGDPAEVIASRGAGYDLVIAGRRPSALRSDDEQSSNRSSICERLASTCKVPVLVVQEKTELWRYASLMMSVDHIDRQFLKKATVQFRYFGMWPEIVCLFAGMPENATQTFVQDLKESEPGLQKETIRTKRIADTLLK